MQEFPERGFRLETSIGIVTGRMLSDSARIETNLPDEIGSFPPFSTITFTGIDVWIEPTMRKQFAALTKLVSFRTKLIPETAASGTIVTTVASAKV